MSQIRISDLTFYYFLCIAGYHMDFARTQFDKQMEELLLQCQPTTMMIEHDKAFVEKIATREVCITAKKYGPSTF